MNAMFRSLVAVVALMSNVVVLAHEGHDHDEPLTSTDAASLADKALPGVIKTQKLNASWQKALRKDAKVVNAAGGELWVVSYANTQEANAANRLLYLFFDDLGNFVTANHTGKLPEA